MRKFWSFLFLLVPILGFAMFVWAWAVGSAWLPLNISDNGKEIDTLFYVILFITGFFFLVTEFLLVHAMFHGHTGPGVKARYFHGNHALEWGWTIMTMAILIFIAIYQLPAWARAKFPKNAPKEVPDAKVTASQFLWQVRYPVWDDKANAPKEFDAGWTRKPDFQQTFEVRNELRVPVGEPFFLHLTTRDVIHSFWLPSVRVKQDALPGHMIPVWFDTNTKGTFEWVCAELCGWGHYRMRGKIVVEDRADYEKWLKDQTKLMTSQEN